MIPLGRARAAPKQPPCRGQMPAEAAAEPAGAACCMASDIFIPRRQPQSTGGHRRKGEAHAGKLQAADGARACARTGARRPRLLLHSCCGPVLQFAVLEALCPHFEVTVDYYNPNIDTAEEYAHRAAEQARFAAAAPFAAGTQVLVAPYEPQAFYAAVKGPGAHPRGRRALLRLLCAAPAPRRRRWQSSFRANTSAPRSLSARIKTPPS